MTKYLNTLKTIDKILLEPPVWDDVRVPGLAVKLGSSSPDLVAFLGAGGLKVYAFDGGVTTEEVHFTIQFPHTYKCETDIEPHVHWAPTTNDAGNVVWQLEYTWINIGGTFGAAATIASTPAAAGGTAWVHKYAEFAAIAGSGKGVNVSSMLVCRLFRDPTHGDDSYAHDAALLEFDCHFEIDTLGSKLETSK